MNKTFQSPLRISKTPLRVSFFGGGTDYPEYFKRKPGAVLGTSINLYINIAALPMTDFCEQKYRLMYGTPESVNSIEEIQHPVIRNILKMENYKEPLNICVMSDVPGGTGLGSSSTFSVGMLKLMNNLKGKDLSKINLAKQAIHLERNILNENVGIQDQIHASFGGLSLYEFQKDDFVIKPVEIRPECYEELCNSMYLIYTKISRKSSSTAKEQIENIKSKKSDKILKEMMSMAIEGKKILEQSSSDKMLHELGNLLDETWKMKKKLSTNITLERIDEIYQISKSLGAYGGKLCGAGAGGFFFLLAPKEIHKKLINEFGPGNVLSISIENQGSQLLIV